MKFFSTIKNIWSIKELRDRILYTLALVAVFRLGSFVVLPGVVASTLKNAIQSRGANDLLSLINSFSGGAFSQAAVFALGVMPYITASIIVQLLGFAVPYFQRLQSKEGESGRKKLNQITRILTVAITLVQAGSYLQLIRSIPGAVDPNVPPTVFWFANIIILTAGTVFCMWLGERITDNGLGNGISLLIMVGIISRLPQAFAVEFQKMAGESRLLLFIVELAALFLVILLTILIIQGVRKVPIQFAKKMVARGAGMMPAAGAREYLPLKVNSAGVMPIIFAQTLMFLPATIYSFVTGTGQQGGTFSDVFGLWYNVVFFILILLFTFVYTALMVNPTQHSDYLKRNNAFIPGVKPGESTTEFLDSIMTRITLPGAIALAFIGILPAIVAYFGVNQAFALFFGGTTLLILVGVALDTLQVIESYLLMRKYDGLTQSGQIQGRMSSFQVTSDIQQ